MSFQNMQLTKIVTFCLRFLPVALVLAIASAEAQRKSSNLPLKAQSVVRAERFELVDRTGKITATLENKNGETRLILIGKRVSVELQNNEGKQPNALIGFGILEDGTVGQSLAQTKPPFPSIVQKITSDGKTLLEMHDRNQKTRVIEIDP